MVYWEVSRIQVEACIIINKNKVNKIVTIRMNSERMSEGQHPTNL